MYSFLGMLLEDILAAVNHEDDCVILSHFSHYLGVSEIVESLVDLAESHLRMIITCIVIATLQLHSENRAPKIISPFDPTAG